GYQPGPCSQVRDSVRAGVLSRSGGALAMVFTLFPPASIKDFIALSESLSGPVAVSESRTQRPLPQSPSAYASGSSSPNHSSAQKRPQHQRTRQKALPRRNG